MTLGVLRADDDRCAVRFERMYQFTPAELWAALTEPERLARWLAPIRAFEPSVGGSVAIDFGDGGVVAGEVLALEPGRLLEYTWTFTGEDLSVVRFELQPRERGTLLVVDHRRLGREHGVGYAAGWHAYLDRLDAALAGRELDWLPRVQELLPAYRRQGVELGWLAQTASPVRDALYRGEREAAEAAAGGELDVFDAAALGRVDRLRELLDARPAVVGELSDDGFTPLHLACFSGGAEAARLLIGRGAPLERLAESPIARVRPLGTAAFARQLACATALLDAGADPSGSGEGGFVPLHAAAQNGDLDLVRLLLDRGADPTRRTADGRAPLDLARDAGSDDCVALLERAAAPPA